MQRSDIPNCDLGRQPGDDHVIADASCWGKAGCVDREEDAVYPPAPLDLRLPSDPGSENYPKPVPDPAESWHQCAEVSAGALTSGSQAVSAIVDVIRPLGVCRRDVG